MKQLPRPEMWDAWVDYVRMTRKGQRDAQVEYETVHAMERVAGIYVDGLCRPEPWSALGYRGVRYGSMAYGYREPEGYMVQGSGIQAQGLCECGLRYTNTPRIDLQVTVWYDRYYEWIAQEVATRSARASAGSGKNPWRVRHISGFGTGDTAYLGTRGKKARFVRVYDKYKESGEDEAYRNAWRYEIEFTDEYANEAYGRLYGSAFVREEIAGIVYSVLRDRGIILAGLDGSLVHDRVGIPRDKPDDERTLRWLEEQVSPAIDKLVARGVSLDEIRERLFPLRDKKG